MAFMVLRFVESYFWQEKQQLAVAVFSLQYQSVTDLLKLRNLWLVKIKKLFDKQIAAYGTVSEYAVVTLKETGLLEQS